MRSAVLAAALAITGLVVACGGKAHPEPPTGDDDADEDGPFVNRPDFEPTAFTVEVSGKGRPVIFIPGLGCPGEMWNETVEHLGERYESHVLTLAGFAGNKPIKPPLAAKVRKQLIRYIRSRKLEGAIVVGHSMGGFIAYWLGETAPPDLLGGIVVVDAGPGLDADAEEARLLRNAWAQAGDDELPLQIRSVFSSMTSNPKKMEPFLGEIAKSDRQAIGDAIYEMVKTDVTDEVERIKVPALIVLADGGLQDRYKKVVESIPHHEVVVVRGTKHFVWFDDPQGFNTVLDKFLARTRSNHGSDSDDDDDNDDK
ncbi:MAG TPA: alpha/beta hydrolase [Kofleriaceae bacterium]|nr:alpha/beta hydrolase [Kofleriaceae bacterium]